MSLDWSATSVKDWQKKGDTNKKHTRDALVWLTLVIGMPRITESNAIEFAKRSYMYERVCDPLRRDHEGNPIYITLGDVQDWIGLRTNASEWTPLQFSKKLVLYVEDGHLDKKLSIKGE